LDVLRKEGGDLSKALFESEKKHDGNESEKERARYSPRGGLIRIFIGEEQGFSRKRGASSRYAESLLGPLTQTLEGWALVVEHDHVEEVPRPPPCGSRSVGPY